MPGPQNGEYTYHDLVRPCVAQTLIVTGNVANYKLAIYLTGSTDTVFEQQFRPGDVAPASGIYRCVTCGREIIAEAAARLPNAAHHLHATKSAEIIWRLIVRANTDEPSGSS